MRDRTRARDPAPVYLDYDDLMARHRVLLGRHVPGPATGPSADQE